MKRAIVILTMIFAYGYANANDDRVSIDPNLIREVKAEMEMPIFMNDALEEEPDVLIYSFDGRLLHSFTKENIDPIAMRNVDLLMNYKSQKIFIKEKELKPTI